MSTRIDEVGDRIFRIHTPVDTIPSLDLLAGSALGELSEAVEEHVVSCDECAACFATFVRLGPAIAALVRAHSPRMAPSARSGRTRSITSRARRRADEDAASGCDGR